MPRAVKNVLVYAFIVVVSLLLLCEVGYCACGWYWALKVTGARLWVVPIILTLLAVGWVPLLIHRYNRKTLLFGLLAMTSAFAVTGALMAMLIVTDVRFLKPLAIMSVSCVGGGLWGWVITYLDRHKWRIGEKLDEVSFGRGPIDDTRARRPILTVAAVTLLAAAVCVGIWVVGKEKFFHDVWNQSDYNGRMWMLDSRVSLAMLIGRSEKDLQWYFGKPEMVTDKQADSGARRLKWTVGTVPADANSPHRGKRAWIVFQLEKGTVVAGWLEYEPVAGPSVPPEAQKAR
jgi:hypothetical protein